MMKPFDAIWWQPAMAVLLCLAGIGLLFVALWMPPGGQIDSSVLIAYGEISTFAGALIGIDYRYRTGGKP